MRFQPFVVVLLALCVASSISRRQRACVKGVGKDYKGGMELNCFQARKIEAQASSLIQAEILFALASAELEERQESSIDITWNDVRSAVVAECPENQFEAAAAFGTCRCQSEKTGSSKCPVWSKHSVFHQRGRRCSDAGGQGRKACCTWPGCGDQGCGRVCHDGREDCGSRIIVGNSWYHIELTALCPSSYGSVVGPERMCLGSGRARIASRSVAGR